MKKININETQMDKIFNNSEENTYEMSDNISNSEEGSESKKLYYFLATVIEELTDVEDKLSEIKDFIENDDFAKNNKIEFEKFFKDINNFSEKVDNVYNNMPYED